MNLLPALLAAQPYGIVASRNALVPMRDGVRLTTDIYRPGRDGRFPVILERTPYGSDNVIARANYFVPRGYVVVGQNVRGRWGSEGSWRPNRDDGNDGYDTAQWIARQPWSDGAIGTAGTSYPGARSTRWRSLIRRS
jgi:putative CocE/NonD family hydrolase